MRGAFFFPLNHAVTDGMNLAWAQKALTAERRFWSGHQVQPRKMIFPERAVTDMITSCARNILQAREIKDGLPQFQVGSSLYRDFYVADGYFLLEAAQYLGFSADAYKGIDVLLRRVKPNGAITQIEEHTKETGIALTTLVRQCELMGDMARLESLWPTIQNAVDYIQRLREESKARGPSAPEYGLMPPSYGDGGLGGKRPEYTTALWTLVGLKAVAGAARRLGSKDSERFQAAYDDLLHTFREHATRDMRTLPDGTPYLPMAKPRLQPASFGS